MRMMDAAIRATFAEWRMVKTRKVLQLVFEVPLEQQAGVLTTLGAPMPDAEIWCGIARLTGINDDERKTPGVAPAYAGDTRGDAEGGGSHSPVASFSPQAIRSKATYATGTEGERARTRAAMLPKDERFQRWAFEHPLKYASGIVLMGIVDEEGAARYIRALCCDSGSRSLIATHPVCLRRFLAMETQYLADTNQLAEERG